MLKNLFMYLFMFVAALAVVSLIGKVLPFNDYINNFIGRTIVSLLLIIILLIKGKVSILLWNKNFFKGLYIGKWLFLIIVANFLTFIKFFDSINFTISTILLLLSSNFIIAFFEEVLTRGIIFNQLLKEYSVIKASSISSAIFGFVHILNLTNSGDTIGTITQVICTFFIGMLLASVYYVTKNIWSSIFLHFILDLSSGFVELSNLEKATHVAQTHIISALLIIILTLPAYYSGKKLLTIYLETNKI